MRGGGSLAARIVEVPPHCLSSAWLVTTQALFFSFALPPEQSMERLFEALLYDQARRDGYGAVDQSLDHRGSRRPAVARG